MKRCRSLSFLVLRLAATALLAACSVGPDYQRPATPEPAAWKSELPVDPQWPSLTWWEGFQSPTLSALMEDAQRANYDVGAAVARVRQADALAQIAGAALLPTISGGGSAARARTPPTTTASQRTGSATVNNLFSGTVSARYELDFWGKYADAANAAAATAQGSRFDQQTTALTVQATVANTYFAILAAQDRLIVAQDNLAAARVTLDSIEARAAAGVLAALDIAEQESVVSEQRAAIPPLVQSLRQNTYALAVLVGKLPEMVSVPSFRLEKLTLPSVGAGLPSDLLLRRPDVQYAEAQLVAANANLKAAVAALFPDINLTAVGGIESVALSHILSPGSGLYSAGAGLTQPIFAGGALEGAIELQRGRWDELTQDYLKAAMSAFADVESALAAVELTAQQEEAQRVSAETARRAYEISQAQLQGGTIDIVTMLNTQRTLFAAEDTLVQVKLAHAQAVVGLFRALGGGWRAG